MLKRPVASGTFSEDPRWLAYLFVGASLGVLDTRAFSLAPEYFNQLLLCGSTGMLLSLTVGILGAVLGRGISMLTRQLPTSSTWLARLGPAPLPVTLFLSAVFLADDPVAILIAALPLGIAATMGVFARRRHADFGWWMLLFTALNLWLWTDLNWIAKLATESSRLAALACALTYLAFALSALGFCLFTGPTVPGFIRWCASSWLAFAGIAVFVLHPRLLPQEQDSLDWLVALTTWLTLLPLGHRCAVFADVRLFKRAAAGSKLALTLLGLGVTGNAVIGLVRTGASPVAGPAEARLTTGLYARLLSPETRLSRFRESLDARDAPSPFLVDLPPPGPAFEPPPQTIVLLTVDALRADRVEKIASPSLLRESWNFTRAYAPSSSTLLSLPAMLASQYPSQLSWKLGVADAEHRIFDAAVAEGPRVWTWPLVAQRAEGHVADQLGKLGYHTHAILSGGYTHFFDSQAGLDAGFQGRVLLGGDKPENHPGRTNADERAVLAFESLLQEKKEQPLFVWLHLFAPHFPYPDEIPCSEPVPYDCDVKASAKNLSRIVHSLKKSGRYEQALVIVTSDHGHSLGENGVGTPKSGKHAVGVYDAQVRVPLLLKLPGGSGGKTDALTSTLDITPTILAAVGAKSHPTHVGIDLRTLAQGSPRPVPVFFEQWQFKADGSDFTERWVGAVSGNDKVFIDERRGRLFQFSLEEDPKEARNRLRPPTFAPSAEGTELFRAVLAFRRATANNRRDLPHLIQR